MIVIGSLPSPFDIFEALSSKFTFLRIHGSYQGEKERKYSYQVFSFYPSDRIYSQRSLNGVDAEHVLRRLGVENDFIKPAGICEGLGHIYVQVERSRLHELLK